MLQFPPVTGNVGMQRRSANAANHISTNNKKKKMKSKSNHPVESWTVQQCIEWITETMKMPEYTKALQENEITGDVLLQLSNGDWKEMGVQKLGHRKRLENGVEELKLNKFSTLYKSATQPSQQILTLSASQQVSSSQSKQSAPLYQKKPLSDDDEGNLMNQLDSLQLIERQCIQCGEFYSQLIHLQYCKHEVCSHCLKRNALDASHNQHVVHCSFCNNLVDDRDLNKVLTDKELQEMNSQMILHALSTPTHSQPSSSSQQQDKEDEVVIKCPTTNCRHVFLWSNQDKDSKYKCPCCAESYCLHCQCKYHFGMSCMEWKASQKLMQEKPSRQQFEAPANTLLL